MSGQLSPELGRLRRLKRLDLGGAVALMGRIEALQNATLLQQLNLSHSQVPGGCRGSGPMDIHYDLFFTYELCLYYML